MDRDDSGLIPWEREEKRRKDRESCEEARTRRGKARFLTEKAHSTQGQAWQGTCKSRHTLNFVSRFVHFELIELMYIEREVK